jgi:outer membrane protein OmpA-like peptidoglycan-associated protein
MAVNLLDLVKQGLPSNFADMAGKFLGESPGTTQTALSSALPALLGSIARQGATPSGAQGLLSLLNNPAVNTGVLGNIAGMFSGGGQQATSMMSAGSGLLNSLLGDKAGGLAGTLASVAGLKSSQSATNLLALIVPLVLGFIKKFVSDNGLNANGLASLLGSQGSFLQGALDSRLTSALGFTSPAAMLGSLAGKAGDAMHTAGSAAASTAQRAGAVASDVAADTARGASGFMRWLPWLIAAAVALFLLSRLSNCGQQPAEKAVSVPPAPPPAVVTAPPPAAPAVAATGLPTKVYFDVGQAALGDDAKKAIAGAVDAIKKDSAKVDITGYTDKTGDAAANETLAKNRAVAVRDALTAAGVPEASISMKPPFFVTGAANDAEARRVDISKSP